MPIRDGVGRAMPQRGLGVDDRYNPRSFVRSMDPKLRVVTPRRAPVVRSIINHRKRLSV